MAALHRRRVPAWLMAGGLVLWTIAVAWTARRPFWSPDGRTLAFFAGGKLKRIAAAGGPVLAIADALSSRGGSWGPGDVIVFVPGPQDGLWEVPAGGGTLRPVTKTSREGVTHKWPWILPDGRHVLFVMGNTAGEDATYVVARGDGVPRRLLADASQPRYSDGYLVVQRDGTLVAHAFDVRRLSLRGAPIPIGGRVSYYATRWTSAASIQADTLLYRAASEPGAGSLAQLTWFERDGREAGALRPASASGLTGDFVGSPGAMSPDGADATSRV